MINTCTEPTNSVPKFRCKFAGLGLPHADAFFIGRVAFRHDASRRNFDNISFCHILYILE